MFKHAVSGNGFSRASDSPTQHTRVALLGRAPRPKRRCLRQTRHTTTRGGWCF